MEELCKNCRFYASMGDAGDCHRYPPGVPTNNSANNARHPWVRPRDWCGEWQPSEEQLKAQHEEKARRQHRLFTHPRFLRP